MEANDIWNPANKAFLDYMLARPAENSAVLFRSHFRSSLKKIFFGLTSDKKDVLGYAYVDFSSLKGTKVIIRGEESVFTSFLETYGDERDATFQFIHERECMFFEEIYGKKPTLKLFYHDLHVEAKLSLYPDGMTFAGVDDYFLRDFGHELIPGIIKFYKFKVNEENVSIFSTLHGIALMSGKKILGAVYDNFSMLKETTPFSLIGGVKVAEKKQNKGICKFLLHTFINRLVEKKIHDIGLFVDQDNMPAKKCYERVGLTKKENYYQLES